jgi:hypothetical protein
MNSIQEQRGKLTTALVTKQISTTITTIRSSTNTKFSIKMLLHQLHMLKTTAKHVKRRDSITWLPMLKQQPNLPLCNTIMVFTTQKYSNKCSRKAKMNL